MNGNLSKTRGVLGATGPQGPQGIQGIQGVKGDTPSIIFKYEPDTGNLYYSSDGILVSEEYVSSHNLATKEELTPLATKSELASYVTSEYLNTIIAALRAEMSTTPTVKTITITLNAADWLEGENLCYQVVRNDAFTQYSKVDLQPSVEQLAIFYEKDISFVTANVAGTVTVYCIGVKPTQDYVMQATITEVKRNG